MNPNASESSPVVWLRHVLNGSTWCLIPVTQLSRSSDNVVLRIASETQWLAASHPGGGRARLGEVTDWELARFEWSGSDLTYLVPFGEWLAYGLLRDSTGVEPPYAYVNFQRPILERPWGFETLDLELDLVGSNLGSTDRRWRWKDRARFESLAEMGLFTPRDVMEVRNATRTAESGFDLISHQLCAWANVETKHVLLDEALNSLALPPDIDRIAWIESNSPT